jgi:hypothetical protein
LPPWLTVESTSDNVELETLPLRGKKIGIIGIASPDRYGNPAVFVVM